MRAILVQQRVAKALDDPLTFSDELKAKPDEIEEMNEIAYSSIILHLSDNIVRQVDHAKDARTLRTALDALFLTKTLPNKIYLLEKLFSFKMDLGKDVEGNLSDYSIIVKSLAHNDKKFDDEDLAVILLISLPNHTKKSETQLNMAGILLRKLL